MNRFEIVLRSIFYNLFLAVWTLAVGVIFFPTTLLHENSKAIHYASFVWTAGLLKMLKFICKLEVEIRGLENIPKESYIVASKHQSALDILVLANIVNSGKFVMKRSLIFVPMMGLYCLKMGMILIDRAGGARTLKIMIDKCVKKITEGQNIIIFPEGTRTEPGIAVRYKSGIAAIYDQAKVKVLPVALNTGCFWPKNSFLKKPGICVVEFLPPIDPGMEKQEFMDHLYNIIESRSNELIK